MRRAQPKVARPVRVRRAPQRAALRKRSTVAASRLAARPLDPPGLGDLLQASELRRLYDLAPAIWMVLDAAGLILDINKSGAEALGTEPRFVVGTPLRVWAHDESRRDVLEHLRLCRETDAPITTVLTLAPKHGATLPVRLYTRGSRLGGRLVFPTFAIDIAAEHHLELARRTAEDDRDRAQQERSAARAAEAAKDRLIATVSHELRNPLSPALMAASTLEALPGLPDRVRAMASVIRRNIELEARLIDDLLDVARATRGQLELRLQEVDAHEILHRAIAMSSAAANAKAVAITDNFAAERHFVRADPARLEQVFWNLINNAVKFSRPRQPVMVHTASDDAGVLTVTVRDYGVGMERETLEHLFSPFEQPRVPPGGRAGLGLGLTIARSIVEAHGGHIWATSPGAGEGAVFEVQLMAVPGRPAPSAGSEGPPRSASATPGHGRVLIVEDHIDSGSVLAACLEDRGYEVRVATTLADGLRELDEPWDAVLSDIGLSDGSGLEIARHARVGGPGPAHLVAFSGYGTAVDIQASRDAGFDTHLVKPIDLAELLSVLA